MQLNWVDLIFFGILFYFALANNGFTLTLIELCGFVVALFVSYKTYGFFTKPLVEMFSIPPGFATVLGFFAAWTVTEFVFFFAAHFFLRRIIARMKNHIVDLVLGYSLGLVQGAVVFLFFISLVFGLPVRGSVKQNILDSKVGPFFVDLSRSSESKIKEVFGQAADETLNFLTIKPSSGETVGLGFKLTQNQVYFDPNSEQIMVELVNKERQTRGLSALVLDIKLQMTARNYARFMLVNGFFSHTSLNGTTAADRAQEGGVDYTELGENLAFAPDVYIAHQGLMNSPGHRANILSPDFSRIGIGIADGGIYGKMFVQMFAN